MGSFQVKFSRDTEKDGQAGSKKTDRGSSEEKSKSRLER